MPDPIQPLEQTLKGIALAGGAYALFSMQDAAVKWLAESLAVSQIMFLRAVVIVVIAVCVGGRNTPRALWQSPNKGSLLLRSSLILSAWMLFYSASRHLGLAELSTIYFVAPIMVVGLSVVILKEKVNALRWGIVALGFGGAVLAAMPRGELSVAPALMALGAAFCWGLSTILVRMISRSESTANQMLATNLFFVVACGTTLPFVWQTPDWPSACLLLALGLAGGLGQWLLFEAFRHAPASVIAPVEYSGLIWAFSLGFLVWGDVPAPNVFAGAALIVASSAALVLSERRRRVGLAAE